MFSNTENLPIKRMSYVKKVTLYIMYCIKIYRLEVTGIHNLYSIEKKAWDATAYSDSGRGCVEGENELVRITIILYSMRFTHCKSRTSAPPLARVYIIILVYSLIKKFSGKNTKTTLLNMQCS